MIIHWWNPAGVDTAFRRQKFYKVTSGKSITWSLTVMAFLTGVWKRQPDPPAPPKVSLGLGFRVRSGLGLWLGRVRVARWGQRSRCRLQWCQWGKWDQWSFLHTSRPSTNFNQFQSFSPVQFNLQFPTVRPVLTDRLMSIWDHSKRNIATRADCWRIMCDEFLNASTRNTGPFHIPLADFHCLSLVFMTLSLVHNRVTLHLVPPAT